MPRKKSDSVRKSVKKSKRGNSPQVASKNGYQSDSAVSEASSETAISVVPSECEKPLNESEDGNPQDFTSEMSKLLEGFRANINKTMQAKRRKVEQLTQESTRSAARKVLETNKIQAQERHKLIDHFQSQLSTMIQQGENEMKKVREAEDKLLKLLDQKQRSQQQLRFNHSQRMKTLRNLNEEFCKDMNILEKHHVEQYLTVHDELREEMALLQKKILMETQQQEMMNVRKHLKQLLA